MSTPPAPLTPIYGQQYGLPQAPTGVNVFGNVVPPKLAAIQGVQWYQDPSGHWSDPNTGVAYDPNTGQPYYDPGGLGVNKPGRYFGPVPAYTPTPPGGGGPPPPPTTPPGVTGPGSPNYTGNEPTYRPPPPITPIIPGVTNTPGGAGTFGPQFTAPPGTPQNPFGPEHIEAGGVPDPFRPPPTITQRPIINGVQQPPGPITGDPVRQILAQIQAGFANSNFQPNPAPTPVSTYAPSYSGITIPPPGGGRPVGGGGPGGIGSAPYTGGPRGRYGDIQGSNPYVPNANPFQNLGASAGSNWLRGQWRNPHQMYGGAGGF